jgi:hypothetical protein
LTHGKEGIQGFLQHLKSTHANIKFTMKVEKNKTLSSLDVPVSRTDSFLGHTVCMKPIHKDLYLHVSSEHHPSQKCAVLSTLIQWARPICDEDSLAMEISHLKRAFIHNKYSNLDVMHALPPRQRSQTQKPPEIAM